MQRKVFLVTKFLLFLMLFTIIVVCEKSTNESDPGLPDPVDTGAHGIADSLAIKVLFVGNSLTYQNDLPALFWNIADAAGKEIYVDQATIPGAQLIDHCSSEFTREKIMAHDWDFVILQEAIFDIAFPEYRDDAIQTIQIMENYIFDNNPKTKVIYFLPWSSKNGFFKGAKSYTYEEAQKLLCDGTVEIAKRLGIMVAPVGWAWQKVIADRPDISMFSWDGSHPAPQGSYLSACVYFVTIFQESVVDNPYIVLIDQKTANYLEDVAIQTVLDSLGTWNIHPDDKPIF